MKVPFWTLFSVATGGKMLLTAAAALLLAGAVVEQADAQTGGASLSQYHNRNRLLFVFAPSPNDARFIEQQHKFAGKEQGFKERDLVRFDIFDEGQSRREGSVLASSEATALRERFGVTRGHFRVLLVGKDGHTAFSDGHPISTESLFGRIDAMPMRRDEMHRQHHAAASVNQGTIKTTASGQQARVAALSTHPDKALSPAQVVKIQMEALQHNDVPKPDSGIATTFAFASPDNKVATGPLEHFMSIVKNPAYAPMLNCKSITYDPIVVDGNTARQRVRIVAADGSHAVYVFLLSKQTDGPFAGCWMNDGAMREEETPSPNLPDEA